MLNMVEILFFIFDYYLYKNDKINQYFYMVDRCMLIVAFNSAGYMDDRHLLLVVLGITLYTVFFIKLYYIIISYLEKRNK